MADKTFVRITNKNIYDKLETMDRFLSKLNGKVLWHTWAIGVLILLITVIISRVI